MPVELTALGGWTFFVGSAQQRLTGRCHTIAHDGMTGVQLSHGPLHHYGFATVRIAVPTGHRYETFAPIRQDGYP